MTDLNLKCPCKDCICIPACRHKSYDRLFRDCDLVDAYEPSYKSIYARSDSRIEIMVGILNPTKWNFIYRVGNRDKHYGMKVVRIIPNENL